MDAMIGALLQRCNYFHKSLFYRGEEIPPNTCERSIVQAVTPQCLPALTKATYVKQLKTYLEDANKQSGQNIAYKHRSRAEDQRMFEPSYRRGTYLNPDSPTFSLDEASVPKSLIIKTGPEKSAPQVAQILRDP